MLLLFPIIPNLWTTFGLLLDDFWIQHARVLVPKTDTCSQYSALSHLKAPRFEKYGHIWTNMDIYGRTRLCSECFPVRPYYLSIMSPLFPYYFLLCSYYFPSMLLLCSYSFPILSTLFSIIFPLFPLVFPIMSLVFPYCCPITFQVFPIRS